MSTISSLTQTGLRLELLGLEMRGLVDRSVKSARLHEIIEYCVPRRLLRSFYVWAMRGNDGHMLLNVEIDYDEHDRQITLAGDGLPDGIAGSYSIEYGPRPPSTAPDRQRPSCPHVGKAVDLFTKAARDQGLRLAWNVRFCDRHAELYKKFGFSTRASGPSRFRDLTRGGATTRIVDSLFPELSVTAVMATDASPTSDGGQEDHKCPPTSDNADPEGNSCPTSDHLSQEDAQKTS